MELEIRTIASRAAKRALAEPDRRLGESSGGSLVWVRSAAGRPLNSTVESSPSTVRNKAWVTGACLEGIADGAIFAIDWDARVTPEAEDVALNRGIELRRGNRSTHAFGFGDSNPPIVAIGSDHGGFALKQHLADTLTELGFRPLDVGTRDERAADYPDFAQAVGERVADGRAHFGVCVDGAGIGSAMTAGKIPGVLPANCWDERTASNAREHNHANVLCLGAGHLDRHSADAVLRTFLTTEVGPGRHARRVDKIRAVETRYFKPQSNSVAP